jgi:hypothetical protein
MKVLDRELRGIGVGDDAKDVILGAGTFRLSSFKGTVIWLIFWKYV